MSLFPQKPLGRINEVKEVEVAEEWVGVKVFGGGRWEVTSQFKVTRTTSPVVLNGAEGSRPFVPERLKGLRKSRERDGTQTDGRGEVRR